MACIHAAPYCSECKPEEISTHNQIANAILGIPKGLPEAVFSLKKEARESLSNRGSLQILTNLEGSSDELFWFLFEANRRKMTVCEFASQLLSESVKTRYQNDR